VPASSGIKLTRLVATFTVDLAPRRTERGSDASDHDLPRFIVADIVASVGRENDERFR